MTAPFVQGNPQLSARRRFTPVFVLSAGAIVGSTILVGLIALLSAVASAIPASVRLLIGGVSAIVLVLFLDVRALAQRQWFTSGPRRQAAKGIQYSGIAEWLIGFIWAFDAGSGVSTYRITSGSWVILILVGVSGATSPWVGLFYGLGLAVGMTLSILTRPDGQLKFVAEQGGGRLLRIVRFLYVASALAVAVELLSRSLEG